VLVVDDNDELRQFIKRALEMSDFFVLDAPGGEEALALLENKTVLDLVLCDVVLPGTKGPELMNQIRVLFPDVKTVFMSGYISEDLVNQDVEEIIRDGDSFIQKPFTTREMLEIVHAKVGA
jgi:two-component system cell cycle sensor histidine kinase/response regulator CckA